MQKYGNFVLLLEKRMTTAFINIGRGMRRRPRPGWMSTDLFSRMNRKLAFLLPVDSATRPPPLVICRDPFWCKASSASLPGTPWADSFRERPSERFMGSFPGRRSVCPADSCSIDRTIGTRYSLVNDLSIVGTAWLAQGAARYQAPQKRSCPAG